MVVAEGLWRKEVMIFAYGVVPNGAKRRPALAAHIVMIILTTYVGR